MSDDDEHDVEPFSHERANQPVSDLPGIAAFSAMGLTAAILIALGVVAGLWVDSAWGSAPWGLVIGIALGTVTAVVSVVKQIRRFL